MVYLAVKLIKNDPPRGLNRASPVAGCMLSGKETKAAGPALPPAGSPLRKTAIINRIATSLKGESRGKG
jgi:hypothetical protein